MSNRTLWLTNCIRLLCFVKRHVSRGCHSIAVLLEMSQLHQLVGPLSGDQAAVSLSVANWDGPTGRIYSQNTTAWENKRKKLGERLGERRKRV